MKSSAIKPSGVDYATLCPEDIILVSLDDGRVVEGTGRPSSDTPTHLVLYRSFPDLGGVVHTHSVHAAAWAQARREIPVSGDDPCGPFPRPGARHAVAYRRGNSGRLRGAYWARHRGALRRGRPDPTEYRRAWIPVTGRSPGAQRPGGAGERHRAGKIALMVIHTLGSSPNGTFIIAPRQALQAQARPHRLLRPAAIRVPERGRAVTARVHHGQPLQSAVEPDPRFSEPPAVCGTVKDGRAAATGGVILRERAEDGAER